MTQEHWTDPKIGMLITCTSHAFAAVPHGMTGVIDVVDPKTKEFWVAVDDGGFFGWTSFASWAWTGQMLPRTAETEGWYQMREQLEGSTPA